MALLVPTLDELDAEFDRALAVERSLSAADGQAYDDALVQLADLCQQVAELPAQNFGHLQLKARAFLWYEHPARKEPSATSRRLAYQLAAALVEGLPA